MVKGAIKIENFKKLVMDPGYFTRKRAEHVAEVARVRVILDDLEKARKIELAQFRWRDWIHEDILDESLDEFETE